jgi:hypothetical protein
MASLLNMDLPRTVYAPPRARAPWPLSAFAGHDRLRVYSLGRWALVEALRLAAAQNKTVLLPDYICRDILSALAQAGARAAFYPVGRNLEMEADPDSLPQACAILSVNYFGFPQDLSSFEKYARRARALLIEDNAHGLLSKDSQGRPLGTRAPLGLLSMRKTLALPDGGALLVNDAALWGRVGDQPAIADKPAAALSFARRRGAARKLARWLGARGMVATIDAARFLRKLRTGDELPSCDPQAERLLPAPAQPCSEALGPFWQADPQAEVERRRGLYLLCEELLKPAGIEPVFSNLPEGTAPYAYPFRASGREQEHAESILKNNGLFSLPWPALPDAVAARVPSFHSTVRAVQFLW